ncbi:MAG: polysaccharide biosynthesis tyrosine autokinase [Deltaproteobacteria bacterium]|nr:polysaccharide biosynthesis tyrosine autokinase [Deltaproteobacteria bacterium]
MENSNNAGPQTRADIGHQIKKFTYVLNKRRWWAILTFIAVLAAVIVYTKQKTPIFRATAVLIVEHAPPRVLSGVKEVVELGSNNYWLAKEYFKTQVKVITGLDVAQRVVTKLHLDEDPDFLGIEPGQTISEQERRRLLADKVPARTLQGHIFVEPVRDSTMIMVSVDDSNPQRAAELVNEVVFAYREQNIAYRRSVMREANSELKKMVEKYRIAKERADQKVLEFEKKHNVGSFDTRMSTIQERIRLFNNKQGLLLVQKSELDSKRARAKKVAKAKDLFSIPLGDLLSSSFVSNLKDRIVALKDQRTSESVTYGDKHPRIKSLDIQISKLEDTLRKEVEARLAVVQGDYEEAANTLKQVNALLADANRDLSRMATLQVLYNTLAEHKKDATEVYDQVRNRYMETSLSAQVETNNVRIQELARVPERPARPDMKLSLAVGGLLGLFMGIGLAFLVEMLDNTIKGPLDAESLLGAPCLGIIPTIPGSGRRDRKRVKGDGSVIDRDFYVLQKPKSAVAEALNTIRTNFLFVLPDRKVRTLLVSSPSPREGKSTVVINLGITLSRFGTRTCIVDADMRRPRLHKTFGLDVDRGLSTILVGDSNLDEAIQPTSVPNLDILPCGPPPPNPSDLLGLPSLAATLEGLKERYDTVILDSPPVIPVSDPRILCRLVDGMLLVVKVGRTTNDSLQVVRRELSAVSARVLGVLLNDLDVSRRGYGYGYGYMYGYYGGDKYGYYGRDDGEKAET